MSHKDDCHKGEEEGVRYKMEVIRCYPRDLNRQISEGCYIQSPAADLLVSGKLDHMQPVVRRMVVSMAVHSGRRRARNTG